MAAAIKFKFNREKAIETLVWLAAECPGIDFFHIVKILYFADKDHLQKYARPILGDTYIAMEHGPVPSWSYDLLKKDPLLDPDTLHAIANGIAVGKEDEVPCVTARRAPNLDLFSQTDLECLREAVEKYLKMPVSRLRQLTHQERAWLEAPANGPMDYALMLDDDLPNRDELVEEIEENAAYAVL